MQAIQLAKPKHFQRVDLPEPSAPGPGEALVRVHRVGICGTDYSGYLGKMPFYSYPRIPGHELGVEVLAVGSEVSAVRAGDRCSVEPYLNCQHCSACRGGHGNCCENLQVLGVHVDGGLRPLFLVPARKLHPSRQLGFEQLALVETLAIGCHAVRRAGTGPQDTVLVIGAGPIGLSVIEFARLSGAKTAVLDLNPRRLDFVKNRMHIGDVVLSKDDGSEQEQLRQWTEGGRASVVIDATGNHLSMSRALEYVQPAGRLVYVGITSKEVTFPHALMHRREMTLFASRNAHPQDFTQIIEWIEAGRIDTRPWLTHRAGFDEMIEAFPQWLKPESGVVKAVVELES